MSLPPIDGNRPAYHINPAHEYDPNIPIILDADFVEASKDVNPRLERIINNVEILRHAIEKLRSILRAMLGLDIIGIVPNHESLPDPADFPIDALFLVLVDETNDSASTVYRRTVNNTWVRVRTVEVNPDEFVRIENFTRYIQQLQSSLNTLGTYVHEVSTTADEAVRLANQAQRTANEREPLQTTATQAEIDAGTSVAVRRFTPALLARAARNTLLTGFALGANSTVVAGDRIIQAIGKLQAQINNLSAAVGSAPAFSDAIIDAGTDGVQRSPTAANLARAARNTLLTGFSLGTNAAVVAGDRIIGAIGKLQAQINAREPAQTTATNAEVDAGTSTAIRRFSPALLARGARAALRSTLPADLGLGATRIFAHPSELNLTVAASAMQIAGAMPNGTMAMIPVSSGWGEHWPVPAASGGTCLISRASNFRWSALFHAFDGRVWQMSGNDFVTSRAWIRTNADSLPLAGGSVAGRATFDGGTGAAITGDFSTAGLQLTGTGTVNIARMVLHNIGRAWINLGMSGNGNLVIGGGSLGNVEHQVVHQGNLRQIMAGMPTLATPMSAVLSEMFLVEKEPAASGGRTVIFGQYSQDCIPEGYVPIPSKFEKKIQELVAEGYSFNLTVEQKTIDVQEYKLKDNGEHEFGEDSSPIIVDAKKTVDVITSVRKGAKIHGNLG